ncbi:MAG TPA: peptidylprolyl isomerase [Rhodocyclaceae bacterium]
MKRLLSSASVLLIASLVATPVLAKKEKTEAAPAAEKPAAAGAALATVNGKAIPKSRMDLVLASQKGQGRPDSEELRKAIRERLITLEAVSQEAGRKGIEKRTDVAAQIDMARQDILINAYLADFARSHQPADAAVKAEYDAYKASMGDKEYKARHILVEKEEEAKDIIARLKKGEKFEDLAKQSKDPGSRDKGGDLDWSVPGNYVKPFADALGKLAKGKYTEAPVKSDFGWHVILLEDTRNFNAQPLEELKPQIVQKLQRQMIDQHVQELRAKAKVE